MRSGWSGFAGAGRPFQLKSDLDRADSLEEIPTSDRARVNLEEILKSDRQLDEDRLPNVVSGPRLEGMMAILWDVSS